MPHPEEVSHEHIDATIMAYLKAEKDLQWTEIALVTLHPREEIRLVLKTNRERYRNAHEQRFRELMTRQSQGVALQGGYK